MLDYGRDRCLCVYHRSYDVPSVSNCEYVKFDVFKDSPRDHLAGIDRLILVGMNRMIGPSNRTDFVFEVIHNLTSDLAKVSVDYTLFRSDPWRSWFHFGAVDLTYGDYTYSYIAESHYKGFVEGHRDADPFSIAEIARWGAGQVWCDYDRFFVSANFEQVETSKDVRREYDRLKKECFEQERTPSAIIRRLSLFADSHCPSRSIPTTSRLFDKDHHDITHTDLGVDLYLAGRARGLMQLTNDISEVFYSGRDG